MEEPQASDYEIADSAEQMTEALTESAGQIMELIEADDNGYADAPLLLMDVQVIEPGWGNTRDNHYYSREMLRRDAKVFEGVKMYATDHRDSERSVRTEVSQIIECPIRFTESGAPVARVAVFDHDFDYSVRQRNKAGKLADLECSILADGQVKEGFELGGRKGKSVEKITGAKAVEWVTRAGAGGKALALVESAEGAIDMEELENENVVKEPVEETETTTTEALHEEQGESELSAQDVLAAILESELPAAVQKRLASSRYATAEELSEAVQRAQDEIGAIKQELEERRKGGRPFGVTTGATESKPDETKPLAERERDIFRKYGMTVYDERSKGR